MKKQNLPLRIFLSILGQMIIALGVGIIIRTKLGTDPASTLQLGIANVLGTSYGVAAMIYNVTILTAVFFVDRKFINVSSVLAIFVIGFTVDGVLYITSGLNIENLSLIFRILVMAVAIYICSVGITMYIYSDMGVAATDSVSEVISHRLKLSYRPVRICTDLLFVIVGYFLGGPVGLGTIIFAVLCGPAIHFSRKTLEPILDKLTLKNNLKDEDFEREVLM